MERAISSDNTPIAYRRAGSGPSLLLVHGTAADHTRWNPLLPILEASFTVHALDRRGRGASGDASVHAIELEADDIAAVVEAIGSPVAVLGHSFGALCALEAACRTSAIDRLILYEPPYVISPTLRLASAEVSATLQGLVDGGNRDAALEYFFREVPRVPPDQIVALRAAPTWPARVAAAHTLGREIQAAEAYPFAPERYRQLQTPTLLLLGSDSPAFFRVATEALAEVLPFGRIAHLPGQQHVAMNTAPDLFLREVTRFMADGGR